MTITKPHIILEDERIAAIKSGYKIIGDGNLQASGKTTEQARISMENNINNIILLNNHFIMDELYNNLRNLLPEFFGKYILYPLFGRDYILTPEEQDMYKIPTKCLCSLYKNDNLFKLRQLGLLPDNYCSTCDDYLYCPHKMQNRELFLATENKFSTIPKLIMAPKSYVYTELIDSILDKFNKLILILDENILNITYRQYNLTPTSIYNFNKLVNRLSRYNKKLKELYKDLAPVLMAIDNAIRYIGVDENNINDKLMEFRGSYNMEDCYSWNGMLKNTAMNKSMWVNNTSNIFNNIINIFNAVKDDDFSIGISIDRDKEMFSYFDNKIDRIRDIVNRAYMTIMTSSDLTQQRMLNLFPDFADNCKFLHNITLKEKAQPKNFYIYRMHNMVYGRYKKDTLINPITHITTNTFIELAKESRRIILNEHSNGQNIGLIISMKEVYEHLKPILSPVALKNDMEVYFDYYFYIEGKNAYNNVNWIILFGSCNIPKRVRDIMHNFWGIDMKDLYFLFGPGQMIQAAHRGRFILRPNEVNLYVFGNIIRGQFKNEKNFYGVLRLKHKKLLNYITKQGGCELVEIEEFMDYARPKVLKILKQLLNEGILRYTLKKRARGRPHKIWQVR